MTNLFALCRNGGELQVKRVQIDQSVQSKIEGIFQNQAAIFLSGISEEIEFGGDWKPDADELLVMNAPAEASIILPATANPLALPTITAANFLGEGIKALFVKSTNSGQDRLLIQLFTAQQILARRFSLMLQGETFRELTEPAFTLDNFLESRPQESGQLDK